MQAILLTVLYALYRFTNNLLQETFPKFGSIIASTMGNKKNKYFITIQVVLSDFIYILTNRGRLYQ